jgi:hypothetical protein
MAGQHGSDLVYCGRHRPENAMRRHILHTAALIAAAGAAGAGLFTASTHSGASLETSPVVVTPTALEVELGLARCNITPENLAAAGCPVGLVATVVADARSYLTENLTQLETADEAVATAAMAYEVAKRRVDRGLATQQQREALPGLLQTLNTAESQRDVLLTGLFEAATDSLSQSQIQILTACADNATRDVPDQYRVIRGSPVNWATLRDALANKRISERFGVAQDPSLSQFLTAVQARSDVSAARAGLNNLPLIESAWSTALAG